jgi:hypothetical protein
MPAALVATLAVRLPPENVPAGPVDGAVNVTDTPLTAFPDESVAIASIETAYCFVTGAVCGDPATATMRVAAHAVFVRA